MGAVRSGRIDNLIAKAESLLARAENIMGKNLDHSRMLTHMAQAYIQAAGVLANRRD